MKNFKLSSLAVLFISFSVFSQSKKPKIELMDLVKEIIVTKKDGEKMQQVWWIPEIYWELSLADSQFNDTSIIEEINATINGYTIIAAADVRLSTFGGLKTNDIESIELVINEKSYQPLQDIPEDLEDILESLKPVFTKMLGQMGSSYNFYVFDNKMKDNISAYKNGFFDVIVNKNTFKYRLPLGSLVPKKMCPEDNQEHNGNWFFCPWHGKELEKISNE